MNETEIWKDVVGYENLYKVSNLGNVMSFWGKTPKLLKLKKDNSGYLRIELHICKRTRKCFLVHRLVAQAFLPNPNNYPVINHKDENPLNNNVNNLEWCTQKYNCNYGTVRERLSRSLTNRKDLSKPVLQFDKNGNFVKEYLSMSDAEKKTGIKHNNICRVCQGKLKYAGNFVWKYKN